MKKVLSILLTTMCALGLKAQSPQTWFDGNTYYTSTLPDGGIVYFTGTSADKEYEFSFGLEVLDNDKYRLVRVTDCDLIPFRTDFGAQVSRYINGNVEVYLIEDDFGNIVWTLNSTSQNHRDALANQLWSKDQPVKKMVGSQVLNPYYFSDFSKTELRSLEEYLLNKSKMNFLEKLNLSLISSELRTPDYLRYNIGDIQVIEEAKLSSVIQVDDAQSFLNALKSRATIHVKENTIINLSEVLNIHSYFSGTNKGWIDYMDEYKGNAEVISESVHNGRQLTLMNLHDITIIGGYNSHIVVDPAYAFVLNFVNCQNIKLCNLTMGHTEEGYCTGGVIGLKSSINIKISDCDLYGCGAYGLVADNSSSIEMNKTVIRDCSYGVMQLFDVKEAVFDGCDFIRNKEFAMVEVDSYCEDIMFSNCRLAQNKGLLFALGAKLKLENCLIHHSDESLLIENKLYLEKDNATKIVITDIPLGKRAVGPDSEQ